MQPYEQLKKAYTIQVTENQAFVHENFNIASKLVSNLIAFLGLPSTPKLQKRRSFYNFYTPSSKAALRPLRSWNRR